MLSKLFGAKGTENRFTALDTARPDVIDVLVYLFPHRRARACSKNLLRIGRLKNKRSMTPRTHDGELPCVRTGQHTYFSK